MEAELALTGPQVGPEAEEPPGPGWALRPGPAVTGQAPCGVRGASKHTKSDRGCSEETCGPQAQRAASLVPESQVLPQGPGAGGANSHGCQEALSWVVAPCVLPADPRAQARRDQPIRLLVQVQVRASWPRALLRISESRGVRGP